MLYVSLGDGGDTGDNNPDADRNGQNTSTLFGSILHLDPTGSDGRTGQYGIPADNPFVGQEGFMPETWCYGFRNPSRFTWDRTDLGGDGRMHIEDIGQAAIEELSIGQIGGNYGWSEGEGTFIVNHSNPNDRRPATAADNAGTGYIEPVAQYDHGEGRAIIGGFVVHGPNPLSGKYVFGDIHNGRIFTADTSELTGPGPVTMDKIDELMLIHNGATTTMQGILGQERVDLRFGQGPNGELYVLSKQDGFVRRLDLTVVDTKFLPGDCALPHGTLDLSDPLCLLGYFFLGDPEDLPWGDGTMNDSANLTLFDTNGDGSLNISDAVRLFVHLFRSGPPPAAGVTCIPAVGCPDACTAE